MIALEGIEMHAWRIEFVASAALATLYLNRRFGGSAQNRSYTTSRRYHAGFTLLANPRKGAQQHGEVLLRVQTSDAQHHRWLPRL